jgi:protein subunit release factor A
MNRVDINAVDLVIDIYRGSANDCAVRITHLPSGICVASEDLPTTEVNQEAAMQRLRQALGL